MTTSIAHLVSHPIQYFAPLYRELATRPEIDLTVFFYSDATVREFVDEGFGRAVTWDVPLLGGYEHRFLPSAARMPISGRFLRRPNWDIVREIASGRYDVLWVHGYAHLTTWLAVAAARARGMRVLVRDEQTLLHPRAPHKRMLKAIALRALYAQSSALYIGEQNRRYFAHYGMPADRMWPARYCVENERLQRRAAELAPQRTVVRARFGITDDAPVVLFAGKLIEKKQPLLLIEAFARAQAAARARSERPAWLLIAGDGSLRRDAEALVARLHVPNVIFAGFLNQSELPDAYAAADLFVLPSKLHETWGLVVSEAMNFGLPVVVSDKVGCAEDLVHPDGNGFVVPYDDAAALADAIATLVSDAGMRARYGAESRRIIDAYTMASAADGIVAASLGARDPHEAVHDAEFRAAA
jgi:glycosyltransferase involved in cell wall biosynthesis